MHKKNQVKQHLQWHTILGLILCKIVLAVAEERHRPTFRRLLGYIHITAKEQSTEDSLYSLLPHLHPHSCSTDCFQQPLRMCCGGVWGAGVYVCVHMGYQPHWDIAHQGQETGLLPEVSVQLGNQVSEQASRDSRSKFTTAPGSGCLKVSFNYPAVSSTLLLSID